MLQTFTNSTLKSMASFSFRDEIVDHGGKSSETQIITKMKNEDEEGEEELFEINIEAVNSIPPPHYWEAFFTATSDALLANCLLPISDLSTAIPMVSSNACTTCSKVMD
ncbi:hypothetical protein ES332_A01G244100v1 [Gossypium tomentosum]|nr:hypothetical protein ES332_A01G244100v1 [Gossypium tomentosum]